MRTYIQWQEFSGWTQKNYLKHKNYGIIYSGDKFHCKGKDDMKTVKVVAVIICDSFDEKKQIFTTERGCGDFKGWWKFPGGKIEGWYEKFIRKNIFKKSGYARKWSFLF